MPSCHDYNNSTNQCELKRCHQIVLSSDKTRIECHNHGSKSKTLSLFLNIISFTGATNFYLGNYGQAVGQLMLFMVFIFTVVIRFYSCCVLCDVKCCEWEICSCLSAKKVFTFLEMPLLVLSIAELIWMIHDFVEIAINGKLDGDGCFLDDDTIDLVQGIVINTLDIGG